MALPTSEELKFQILNILSDQKVHELSEMKNIVATKFDVSGDDRKKILKNKRPVFDTRMIHALTLLRKNGHIVNQKRANFKITKSGVNRLKNI